MLRLPNWNVTIVEQIGSLVGSEFVWGKTDCVSMGRQLSVLMYGRDIFKEFINSKYTTKAGAVRAYKKHESFDAIILKSGGREVPHTVITDGDIAVGQSDYNGFQNVVVRVGGKWIMASEERGVIESHRDAPQDTMKIYRI